MPQLVFNAQQVAPQQPYEPVPEGWYPVMIKHSEIKPSQNNPANGLVALELEIIDGPMRGRKLFDNLNLYYSVGNNVETVVKIAAAQMSAYCHVTGRYVINATEELHNIAFQAKVTVVGNKNEIKGLKDTQGNDPGKQGQGQQGARPAAQQQQPQTQQWGSGAAAGGPGPGPAPAPAPAGQWGGQQQPTAAPAGGGWQAPAGSAPAPAAGQQAWGGGAQAPAQQQQPAVTPQWGGAPAGGTPGWGR